MKDVVLPHYLVERFNKNPSLQQQKGLVFTDWDPICLNLSFLPPLRENTKFHCFVDQSADFCDQVLDKQIKMNQTNRWPFEAKDMRKGNNILACVQKRSQGTGLHLRTVDKLNVTYYLNNLFILNLPFKLHKMHFL